jgi:hypothetical protein
LFAGRNGAAYDPEDEPADNASDIHFGLHKFSVAGTNATERVCVDPP